ncbi:MAG: glycosyltransferase family 4 protein [Anaerolineae bacterium]|jgi:glycosyltransferase involved in cell wall biosynthesis|nr:glycosyltransferase family 4 protein [Anaerolineae bacterium]
MKVLMIEPLGFSGICYYTASLCRALQPLVENLTLLTARNYELDANQEPYTVLPLLGGMSRGQSKIRRVLDALGNPFITLKVIRNIQPTIVHFQDSFIPFIEIWSVGLAGLSADVIYTVHDVERSTLFGEPNMISRLAALALRRIYHSADLLIVHSQNSLNELQKCFSVDASRTYQLPLGVLDFHVNHLSSDRIEARTRLQIPADRTVALFFGNLKKAKGLDCLLESLQWVIKRLPNFLLIVAGSPRSENTADYMNMARNLGVDDFVRFDLRYIPLQEAANYFLACDFVVLPYQKVYQSGVVTTAYAFGRPVIATRVGGLSEVVEDGSSGYLVDDPKDVLSLADKIVLMGADKTKRRSMENYVKELARTKYSWEAIARETEYLYRRFSV